MGPLKGTSLVNAPEILINMKLGWKSLPETNTLAYDKILDIMDKNVLLLWHLRPLKNFFIAVIRECSY